jgi:hypothetical protein
VDKTKVADNLKEQLELAQRQHHRMLLQVESQQKGLVTRVQGYESELNDLQRSQGSENNATLRRQLSEVRADLASSQQRAHDYAVALDQQADELKHRQAIELELREEHRRLQQELDDLHAHPSTVNSHGAHSSYPELMRTIRVLRDERDAARRALSTLPQGAGSLHSSQRSSQQANPSLSDRVRDAIEAGDATTLHQIVQSHPHLAYDVIAWGDSNRNVVPPLHFVCDAVFRGLASQAQASAMADVLLDAGVDVNLPYASSGDTFLITAASLGAEDVGLRLVAAGANVHARGLFGATALHWACRMGLSALAEALIAAGADSSLKDSEYSSTPLGWALDAWTTTSNGYRHRIPDVCARLVAHGVPVPQHMKAKLSGATNAVMRRALQLEGPSAATNGAVQANGNHTPADGSHGLELDRLRARVRQYFLRYHRADSFRKSLTYQKQYLILLLGGFQKTESMTLQSIAEINGPVSGLGQSRHACRGKARFRKAALAVIAAHRLRMLRARWQSAAHMDGAL